MARDMQRWSTRITLSIFPEEKPGVIMQLESSLSQGHSKEFSARFVPVRPSRGIFDADKITLLQGVQTNEQKEFRCSFCRLGATQSEFGDELLSILCYRGILPDPQWIDRDRGMFLAIFVIAF